MRIKPIITTVFGIAIAAGSVFVANNHLLATNDASTSASQSELVEIYLARSEIAFGQTIERHLVTVHAWPRDALPPGAFSDLSLLVPDNPEQLRRAKGRFYPGEVVIASKVSNFGEKVTLVQKLGENTRAMAIKVDAVTAVGGFVTPGDYVDIVLTQGRQLELSAVTILQKIRVIGVDQQSEELNEQPEVARTITVEVTPEQGQRLALAQKAGTLSLTLRTLEGVEDKPLEMVRLRDLLQEESPVEKSEIQPTVKVRRGTDSEIVIIKRSVPISKPAVEQPASESSNEGDTLSDPARPVESSQTQTEPSDDAANVATVLTSDIQTQ
ncbi:Flp pilus assembly protein CpaB [Roseovarius phycicola]|uniref:Flp pilus assembly protein CpaB n=1 Tax=Roseovarius phycicola TaxID=3080976 RepID=A0ABZ2HEP9_9RHOB